MTGRRADPAGLGEIETRIGYAFVNAAPLRQALTHSSAISGAGSRIGSYERLEFLGDHVLGLVVSAMLHQSFPGAEEGELSRRLAGLVRRETCADVARDWAVGPAMILGDSEAGAGGREKSAILSNMCEAIIGAVFVDGGYSAADAVVRRAWTARMNSPSRPLQDPKTALQEWAQSLGRPTPVYRETARTGPAHAPCFTLAVAVHGFEAAVGSGTSKRNAEQAAAETFLKREGLLPPVTTAVVPPRVMPA